MVLATRERLQSLQQPDNRTPTRSRHAGSVPNLLSSLSIASSSTVVMLHRTGDAAGDSASTTTIGDAISAVDAQPMHSPVESASVSTPKAAVPTLVSHLLSSTQNTNLSAFSNVGGTGCDAGSAAPAVQGLPSHMRTGEQHQQPSWLWAHPTHTLPPPPSAAAAAAAAPTSPTSPAHPASVTLRSATAAAAPAPAPSELAPVQPLAHCNGAADGFFAPTAALTGNEDEDSEVESVMGGGSGVIRISGSQVGEQYGHMETRPQQRGGRNLSALDDPIPSASPTAVGHQRPSLIPRHEFLDQPEAVQRRVACVLRMHMLGSVRGAIEEGHVDFINEIRPLTCMFLGFPSLLDPKEGGATAGEQVACVQNAIQNVQNVMRKYDGSFLQFR